VGKKGGGNRAPPWGKKGHTIWNWGRPLVERNSQIGGLSPKKGPYGHRRAPGGKPQEGGVPPKGENQGPTTGLKVPLKISRISPTPSKVGGKE